MRKIPFAGIELTSQRVRGYMVPLSYRGDRTYVQSGLAVDNTQAKQRRSCCVSKENLNASRPSEHPPVREENVKTFRLDHRLQIQNLFMTFKRVPRW